MSTVFGINRTQTELPKLLQTIRKTGVYSAVIALIPILSAYYSGVPGLNLADIILALLWLPVLFFFAAKKLSLGSGRIDKQQIAIVSYVLYCILLLLAQFLLREPQLSDIAVRTARISFYLVTVVVLAPLMCNMRKLLYLLMIVSLFASAFLLIQVYAYRTLGAVIPGYLPFLPLYTSQYESFDYAGFYAQFNHRPTSFFLEPAHFSRYASLGLAVSLFYYYKQKKGWTKIVPALFITAAIALSTSSIGMMLAGSIWVVYTIAFIRKWFNQGQYRRAGILLMCSLLGVTVAYLFSSSVQFTVARSLSFGHSSALEARLGSLLSVTIEKNLFVLLFGRGYGTIPATDTWMSSLTYILYGTGISGLCLVLFSVGCTLIRKKESILKRAFAMLFLFLIFVDDSFNSVSVVLLYSLVLMSYQRVIL